MTEHLIKEVAELWVMLGGDANGVEWTWKQLRDEVRRIEQAGDQHERTAPAGKRHR